MRGGIGWRCFLALGAVMLAGAQAAQADPPIIYISAFAAGEQGAIHALRWNDSGSLQLLHRTTDIEHPFFLALSPDQRFLYAIHAAQFGGAEDEQIAAFAVESSTGRLRLLNRQSSRGAASCYLDVDRDGRSVVVANYSTGSVAALPVRDDGSLGPAGSFVQHEGSSVHPQRQTGPFAHCIVISPDNRFALAADLGLDKILCYRLDSARARLTPHQPPFARTPRGAGPRHLTFHPNGRHLYVINELSNSITHYAYEAAAGRLRERQTVSTLPDDFTGTSYCADLKITPDGRFLYGTNRGHDSVACYRIAADGGLQLLKIVGSRGKGPQNLAVNRAGNRLLCANMAGDNVAVFAIDRESGELTPSGEPLAMPRPSCILMKH